MGTEASASLTFGSLFSGCGALDLGLERAGMRAAWHCEVDADARAVLMRHWPHVPLFGDVRDVTRPSPVDLICGGFPCQNLSHANVRTRDGLAGAKSGLWAEFARIVAECDPRFVLVENIADGWREWVPSVRSDLRRLGYASVPLLLRASDFGAPHQGARVFVVAASYVQGESARAVDAQMAQLPGLAEPRRQDWGHPSARALGVADGSSRGVGKARLRLAGNAVVPAMGEALGRALMGIAYGH